MQKSLCSFTFDKAKAGRILKMYIEESPYSQRQVAPLVGMTDDMLSNVVRGLNKEISFERVFKICTLTGHSICEFQKEMLAGEEIDFEDQVNFVCVAANSAEIAAPAVNRGVVVRQTEVLAQKTEIINEENHPLYESIGADVLAFLRADRAEQAQRTNDIHDAYTLRLVEQYKDQIQQLDRSRQITIDHYEQRVALINDQHQNHIADIKAGHTAFAEECAAKFAKVEELYQKAIHRKNVWITVLAVLFVAETAAVIGLFIYDSLHRDRGWLRGFTDLFSSGAMECLRSMISMPLDSLFS